MNELKICTRVKSDQETYSLDNAYAAAIHIFDFIQILVLNDFDFHSNFDFHFK